MNTPAFCAHPCPTKGCRCPNCGHTLTKDYNKPPIRNCPGETSTPSVVRQGWNYSKAVAKWELAGCPERSQGEIDRIHAICAACPEFRTKKNGNSHCQLCGCSLSKAPDGLRNKIAMATEHCPIGKW